MLLSYIGSFQLVWQKKSTILTFKIVNVWSLHTTLNVYMMWIRSSWCKEGTHHWKDTRDLSLPKPYQWKQVSSIIDPLNSMLYSTQKKESKWCDSFDHPHSPWANQNYSKGYARMVHSIPLIFLFYIRQKVGEMLLRKFIFSTRREPLFPTQKHPKLNPSTATYSFW